MPFGSPDTANGKKMADDIINRLLPFIHDEMRMPAGLIKDVIEEIERLRAEVARLNTFLHPIGVVINQEVRGE